MPTNKKGYKILYYRKNRAKIIKILGGKCLKCSTIESLEIHHVRDKDKKIGCSAGQSQRLKDWKENIENLALLCYEHHKEYHALAGDWVNFYTLFNFISGNGSVNKDGIPF